MTKYPSPDEPHRSLLEQLANALALKREMGPEELHPWLRQIGISE